MALLPARPPRHRPREPPEAADRTHVRRPVAGGQRSRTVLPSELGVPAEACLGRSGDLPGAPVPPESTAAESAEHLPGSSLTRCLPGPTEEYSGC